MFTRRTATTVLALGTSAALLVGCSEPETEDTIATGTTGATSEQASSAEPVTITVYTSEPEEKVDEINAAFMEANPDIKVEVYRAGTGDLNARIAAEKASGSIEADVLWAADAPTFESYAEAGDLAELESVDSSEVIEEARDEENFYVGTRIIPTVIAYNTSIVDEADLPQSWADLTDPKYADMLVMPDPAVSGAAAFNASVWKNDPALGEEWINALGENNPMIAQSNARPPRKSPAVAVRSVSWWITWSVTWLPPVPRSPPSTPRRAPPTSPSRPVSSPTPSRRKQPSATSTSSSPSRVRNWPWSRPTCRSVRMSQPRRAPLSCPRSP